jgi:DNA-binding CsgD family transcriptional regulator
VPTPANQAIGGGTSIPRSFETTVPAVIFLLIALCIGADFVGDVARGESTAHLAGMLIGTVLSLGGLALMLRILKASRDRAHELARALDGTRTDLTKWRAQAASMIDGLGALIDKQFTDWDLSPAEREVALLLLKGLSLKDIAGVRGASEPTVRQQAQAVYRKGDLAGRAELAAFFLEDLLQPREHGTASAPAAAERALSLPDRARA